MNTLSQIATRQSIGAGLPFLPRLGLMIALWRSRRALAALSPEQLRDIGVSEQDARQEARRPPWDLPVQWRG